MPPKAAAIFLHNFPMNSKNNSKEFKKAPSQIFWMNPCLKTGTSRHWNFSNRTQGSRVTTISVGNMKNKAISLPQPTLNSGVLRAVASNLSPGLS